MPRLPPAFQQLARQLHRLWVVGVLFGLYALAGAWWLPQQAQRVWLPALAQKAGLTITARALRFDPFAVGVTLDGLSVTDAAGQPVLALDGARMGLRLLDSLRQGRPSIGLELDQPRVRLARGDDGQWRLSGVAPGVFSPTGEGASPVVISHLSLHGGVLEWTDAQDTPAILHHIGGLRVSVSDARAGAVMPVRLAQEGTAGESLRLEGEVALHPLTFTLSLKARQAALVPWLRLLKPAMEWQVTEGRLDADGQLHFQGEGLHGLSLRANALQLSGLHIHDRRDANRAYRVGRLGLMEVLLQLGGDLSIGRVEAEALGTPTLHVGRLMGETVHSPAGEAGLTLERLTLADVRHEQFSAPGIDARRLAFDDATRQIHMATLVLPQIGTGWGHLDAVRAEALIYELNERRVLLARASAERAMGAWGQLDAPTVQGLTYSATAHRVELAECVATALRLDGKAAPRLTTGALQAMQLQHALAEHRISVASGSLTDLVSPEVKAARLEIEALQLEVAQQRFQVRRARLSDAAATGAIEPLAASGAEPPTLAPLPAEVGSREPDPYEPRQARIGTVQLEEARGALGARVLSARLISSDNAQLDILRRKDQSLDIRGLPALMAKRTVLAGPREHWHLEVDAFLLDHYSVNVFDETTEPPVRLRFNELTLKSSDITSEPNNDTEFRLQTQIGSSSRFEAEGRLQLQPLRASFRFGLDKLRLRSLEPYVRSLTNVDLKQGRLSLWGDVIAREDAGLRVDYDGGAEVLEFEADDRVSHQPVLKWDLLKFDGLSMSNRPNRFVTRVLTAEQPYARVALDEKRQLNLLAELEPPSQAAIPESIQRLQVEETPVHQLPSASIGLLRVKEGVVDFSDRSMTPGFASEIRRFDGTVSGLSSRADAMAHLVLDGRINGNSPAQVFGELDPMDYRDHTDVTMHFNGLNLTSFSAYSGRFGGYRIERGKLDMDLRYLLINDQLEVENRAVLDKLTLGDRVDDSGSWLVDLAIAILKNGDGRIDIDLPVYGDLSNPQFSLWSLYRDAFTSLLTKFYYAPASLVDEVVNGEELTRYDIPFEPGERELSESATEALKYVAASMDTRPAATLDIEGVADPRQDKRALARAALGEELKRARREELRAQGIRLHGAPVPELSDEDYRRLFTAYYRQQHPYAAEWRSTDARPLASLSGRAFDLAQARVLDEWPIDETTLRALGMNRAESIRGFLIEKEGISDQRLFLRDVKLNDFAAGTIRAQLALGRD